MTYWQHLWSDDCICIYKICYVCMHASYSQPNDRAIRAKLGTWIHLCSGSVLVKSRSRSPVSVAAKNRCRLLTLGQTPQPQEWRHCRRRDGQPLSEHQFVKRTGVTASGAIKVKYQLQTGKMTILHMRAKYDSAVHLKQQRSNGFTVSCTQQ